MEKKLTDTVTWVGKTDWELVRFHGDEYSTHRGTSYNAYLVRDQKTVLVDTIWQPFDKEFVRSLRQVVDLHQIDAIVCNHAEIDHSGSLCELMREIPDTPIYCTSNGVKILKGHYHQNWHFVPVKTGDALDIGDQKLIFIEAPMLHWPDTMFTYLTGDNILFSNDGFGQHYASEMLYNDCVDQGELFAEAIKYYANILTPFSRQVTKKINDILALNLPVDMICPSHGIIWRDKPAQIIETYLKWAADYQENQITLVYDSMWGSTGTMAKAIARGIQQVDPETTVKLCNVARTDKNDIITEMFKSKAILVGSATINNGLLFSISGILEMMRGLKFKNKKAAAFGSYGWSGEAVKQISGLLSSAGFSVVNEGIRELWVPDESVEATCEAYGKAFAQSVRETET
ncbi:MAG: anaerobic nitric oxide reductase flavorubredoxin [Clostridiaceae bacterium]|jgi:flavorubredoxin|nr:anaerobic nitric oxide reductase flavorubredoxin [Clostridiaceae bacterium]